MYNSGLMDCQGEELELEAKILNIWVIVGQVTLNRS